MDDEEQISMSLSLSIVSVCLCACILLAGITVTAFGSLESIGDKIIKILEATYYIAAIMGFIIAKKAYNSWKIEFYLKRMIQIDEEILIIIDSIYESLYTSIELTSKPVDLSSNEEISRYQSQIISRKKDIEKSFKKTTLTAKRPLISDEIRQVLLTIQAYGEKLQLILQLLSISLNKILNINEKMDFFKNVIEKKEATLSELENHNSEMDKLQKSLSDVIDFRNEIVEECYGAINKIKEREKELTTIRLKTNKQIKS